MVKVMLVDDHPIWRDALERDLVEAGYEVVGAFDDGEAAVRIAPAVRPDVVLMDLQLSGMSGVDAAAALVQADPSVRILMFSQSGEDADVLAAVKVGARGYLVKSARRAELLDAVARTAAGEAVFSPGLAALVLGE
jgi:DNA-binding NarL/FixJ family response regulator